MVLYGVNLALEVTVYHKTEQKQGDGTSDEARKRSIERKRQKNDDLDLLSCRYRYIGVVL